MSLRSNVGGGGTGPSTRLSASSGQGKMLASMRLLTVAGWFRLKATPSGSNTAWSFDRASFADFIQLQSGASAQLNAVGTGPAGTISGPTMALDTWYYLALVANGNSCTYYWMAVTDPTFSSGTGNIAPGTGNPVPDRFVLLDSGGGERFNGNVAGLKIWEAVLTSQELLHERYAWEPLRAGNVWGWWPLELRSPTLAFPQADGNQRSLPSQWYNPFLILGSDGTGTDVSMEDDPPGLYDPGYIHRSRRKPAAAVGASFLPSRHPLLGLMGR